MQILIVDDHELFLDGLALVLKGLSSSVDVTSARSASDALTVIESTPELELILLDLDMPGIDGLAFLQALRERKVCVPAVVISASEDPQQIHQAMNLGAFGYIPKSFDGANVISALQTVLAGDVFLPREIERRITRMARCAGSADGDTSDAEKDGITKRQRQVLELLAKGYSNQEVAQTLYVSEHTVKSHVMALFNLLNVRNRTECVQVARRRGLVQQDG